MAKQTYPLGPRVTIQVDNESIDGAIARDSQHCMIADSIKKSFPSAAAIAVDLQTIRFSDRARGLRYTYLTPRVAQVQLVKYDQGVRPDPFAFVLKNAHVTRAGSTAGQKRRDKKRRSVRGRENLKAHDAAPGIRSLKGTGVAVPVGGETPPLQQSRNSNGDNVPFTRRRAFGLRGLEL